MDKREGRALCEVLKYLRPEREDYAQLMTRLATSAPPPELLARLHIWSAMETLYEYLLHWRAGWIWYTDPVVDDELKAYRQWRQTQGTKLPRGAAPQGQAGSAQPRRA